MRMKKIGIPKKMNTVGIEFFVMIYNVKIDRNHSFVCSFVKARLLSFVGNLYSCQNDFILQRKYEIPIVFWAKLVYNNSITEEAVKRYCFTMLLKPICGFCDMKMVEKAYPERYAVWIKRLGDRL